MALGYISSLANSKGPLSDALNAAAKLEQATGNKTKAGKQFLEELYRLLESGEIHLAESVTPPKIDVAPGQTALFGDAIDSVSMNETEAMDALITARRGALAEDAIDAERARLTDDAKRLAKRLGVTDWQDDIELSRKLREGIENDPQAARFGLEDPPHPLPDDHPLLRDTSTINTKERQEMRAQWIEDHFKSKEPVPKDEQPILVMMGGGAASGKGRVKRVLRAGGKLPAEKNTVFIDADEVKEVIPEFKRLVEEGDARAAPTVHEESSKVAKGALGQAFSRRHHVMLDGTMGNPRKMARVIREAKAAGYEVRVVGVTIDPDEALLRMYTRGRLTGRWVPVNRLLEAHAAFSRNFEKFAKAADQADLFDNSGETAINVAAKARGGKLRILDETANTRFNNKGKLSGKEDTIQELRETVEGKKLARGGVLEEGVEAGREGAAGGRAEEGARQPSGVHGDLDPEPVTDPLTGDAVDIAAQRRGEFDELVEQHGDQLQLPTGEVDAQGRPLTRPAAEVVAEIDNEAGRIRSLLDCMRA
ncbi:MAG: zeta toxin family protein [Dehalococcoidia bacterium]